MVENDKTPDINEFLTDLVFVDKWRNFFLANRTYDLENDVELINSASPILSEIAATLVPTLAEYQLDTNTFLERIAEQVIDSREEMTKAKRIAPHLDSAFLGLPEDAQNEFIFAKSDADFMFVRREISRRKLSPRPDDNPETLTILMKEFGAYYENEVLHLDESWPWRRRYLDIPWHGSPIVFYETAETKAARLREWSKNNDAQEALARDLGILNEGEKWHNFVRRKDIILFGPVRDNGSYEYDETDLTVGFRAGIPAEYGRESDIYFGGLPTYITIHTKFAGVRASIKFDAAMPTIDSLEDSETPLDRLIQSGLATPRMTLRIPTKYYL